jgi:hypothetical protein
MEKHPRRMNICIYSFKNHQVTVGKKHQVTVESRPLKTAMYPNNTYVANSTQIRVASHAPRYCVPSRSAISSPLKL